MTSLPVVKLSSFRPSEEYILTTSEEMHVIGSDIIFALRRGMKLFILLKPFAGQDRRVKRCLPLEFQKMLKDSATKERLLLFHTASRHPDAAALSVVTRVESFMQIAEDGNVLGTAELRDRSNGRKLGPGFDSGAVDKSSVLASNDFFSVLQLPVPRTEAEATRLTQEEILQAFLNAPPSKEFIHTFDGKVISLANAAFPVIQDADKRLQYLNLLHKSGAEKAAREFGFTP